MKKYFIKGIDKEIQCGENFTVTFTVTPETIDTFIKNDFIEEEDFEEDDYDEDYEEEDGCFLEQEVDDLLELVNGLEEKVSMLERNNSILSKSYVALQKKVDTLLSQTCSTCAEKTATGTKDKAVKKK